MTKFDDAQDDYETNEKTLRASENARPDQATKEIQETSMNDSQSILMNMHR